MGTALWIYKINDDGSVEKVTAKKYSRWYQDSGSAPFPSDAGKTIRILEILVSLENRRFAGILRMIFNKQKVAADGSIDYEFDMKAVVTKLEAAGFGNVIPRLPRERKSNVIDASGRFEARGKLPKYTWKPTPEIMESVRTLVEKRAGRKIPWDEWPVRPE